MKPIPSVLAAPWAIEPHWLRVTYGVWSRGKIDAAALAQARAEWEARKASRPRLDEPGAAIEGTGGTLRIVGNVGVLSIEGPLFRHAGLIVDWSGGTSYDALHRGLEAALASNAVTTILLRCNSPGGEADGVNELAKAIAAAAKEKEVWAYVDGLCASACLWLAVQADHIVAEESSEVGSIGVRCGIVDYSGADAAAGIREIEIISSQSPGKRGTPVDDEVVGRLQTRIDDLAELFVAAVASGRGVDVETVLSDFGQGDVMIASKALAAGLIDELGNFSTTLAALSAVGEATPGRSARAKERTMPKELQIKAAADSDEWQCSGCNEMMGPSAKAYCAKCSDDDGDEENEDDAKALGLAPKTTAAARRERMSALAALELAVLEATGAKSHGAAIAAISNGTAAIGQVGALQAQLKTAAGEGRARDLRGMLEAGLQGAPGKAPTLSLGSVQKSMASVLRGETKKAWTAAMAKLTADADQTKGTVTAKQIVAAACAVAPTLSDEDMEALSDYAGTSAPVAAASHVEPYRDGEKEGAELDAASAEVAKLAKQARAVLDRNVSKPAAK